MNKTASIIIAIGLIIGIGVIIGGSSTKDDTNTDQVVQNSVIKDGIQYVTIEAKGGYSPRISTAKSDIPTKLVVKTDGTYDCSSALVIRSLNYQKILPNKGETVIDIGTPKSGDTLEGVCSMGMYSFTIGFQA